MPSGNSTRNATSRLSSDIATNGAFRRTRPRRKARLPRLTRTSPESVATRLAARHDEHLGRVARHEDPLAGLDGHADRCGHPDQRVVVDLDLVLAMVAV